MRSATLEQELAVFHDRMWELGLLAPGVRLTVPDIEHPVARALATLIGQGGKVEYVDDAYSRLREFERIGPLSHDMVTVSVEVRTHHTVARRGIELARLERESVSLGYAGPPEGP